MADRTKTTKPKGTVDEREQKIRELQEEIKELQQPDPVEYPKTMYHPDQPSTIVNDAEAEKKLGAGWTETPADFPATKARVKDESASAGPAKVAHDQMKHDQGKKEHR